MAEGYHMREQGQGGGCCKETCIASTRVQKSRCGYKPEEYSGSLETVGAVATVVSRVSFNHDQFQVPPCFGIALQRRCGFVCPGPRCCKSGRQVRARGCSSG